MIEVENTDLNIVRNLIPMRNLMPASAYGLKAISDWFFMACLHISTLFILNYQIALYKIKSPYFLRRLKVFEKD